MAGPDRLREYLDLLIGSLDEDLRGADLADRAHLSRFHFDRLVRAATGESPGAFRRRLLLERGAWWLSRSNRQVADVAFDSGYGSHEAFTRAFGRAFGVPPADMRGDRSVRFWLDAPNGVHFHPPAGLILPGSQQGGMTMNLNDRLVAHHLWLTERLLDRCGQLSDGDLDRGLDLGETGVSEVVEAPTVRNLIEHLISEVEGWTGSISGEALPVAEDHSLEDLHRRLAIIGPKFSALVRAIDTESRWEDAFVDTSCDPPESFSLGGAIAHVLTFSAYRRELLVGALRSLGAPNVGYGDPIEWERSLTGG